MSKKSYDLIIPSDYNIKPAELEAARILANYFKADVRVLSPSNEYMVKTADFLIKNKEYELKSPITKNVKSIEKIIKHSTQQSKHLIIDMRKTKIREKKMITICENMLGNLKKLNEILLIVNKKKIVDFRK